MDVKKVIKSLEVINSKSHFFTKITRLFKTAISLVCGLFLPFSSCVGDDPPPYTQIGTNTDDNAYQAIIRSLANDNNVVKLRNLKDLKETDIDKIRYGILPMPSADKMQLSEDIISFDWKSIDFGFQTMNREKNSKLFEYAFSKENLESEIQKNLIFEESVIYLGLSCYRKDKDSEYEFGVVEYYSGYSGSSTDPAFSISLDAHSSSFDTGIVDNILADQDTIYSKGFVVVGVMDGTKFLASRTVASIDESVGVSKSQRNNQASGFIFEGGRKKNKKIQLEEGLTIASTGKLIGSANNGIGLGINDDTNVEANIHNYGEISGRIAIKIGNDKLKALPITEINNYATLNNYSGGLIKSTDLKEHIAIQASGIKDKVVDEFKIANAGIIDGGLKVESSGNPENMLVFSLTNDAGGTIGNQNAHIINDGAILNIINQGAMIISGASDTEPAFTASNYTARANSTLTVMLSNSLAGKEKPIISIDEDATFEPDSMLVLGSISDEHPEYFDEYTKLIAAGGRLLFSNDDPKFNLAVKAYDRSGNRYIIDPTEIEINTENNLLQFKAVEKQVGDAFPEFPVLVKDVYNRLAVSAGIEKLMLGMNMHVADINMKELYKKIKDTEFCKQAFENSRTIEEFLDNIMPDNSGSKVIANHRINNKFTNHVNNRIKIKALESRRSYTKNIKNLGINYGQLDNDLAIWSGISYHKGEEELDQDLRANKLKGHVYSVGMDTTLNNGVVIGCMFGIGTAHLERYSAKKISSANLQSKEGLFTLNVSLYGAHRIKQVDTNMTLMFANTEHKPKGVQGQNLPAKNYNTKVLSILSNATYPMTFGKIDLDFKGKLGFSKFFVPDTVGNAGTINKQQSHIVTAGIGVGISESESFAISNRFGYSLGLSYNHVFTGGDKKVVSVVNSNLDGAIKIKQRLPSKKNVSLNGTLSVRITDNLNCELNGDYLIEHKSKDYSGSISVRYHF